MTLLSLLRAFRRSTRGIAATETAIVAPLVVAIVIGVADTGMALNERIDLDQGLRAGAQTALMNSIDTSEIETVALNAVDASSNGGFGGDGLCNVGQTCATATQVCECAGVTTACNILCAGAPPPSYIELTLERRHEALFGPDRRVRGNLKVQVR